MNEPIVSPFLVYMIGVCDTVWTGALCVAMVGAIFCTMVFILASLDACDYGEFDKKAAKLLKTLFFCHVCVRSACAFRPVERNCHCNACRKKCNA